MAQDGQIIAMERNLALYPWFKFAQSLMFWQAVWFLYFQNALTPAAAIALYAVYDISVTLCEVPLGVLSDRIGRKRTLIASGLCGAAGAILLALGDSFAVFVIGQVLIGAGAAFASGTDSALLYESLAESGRAEEVEQQETRALQYALWGFAFSAALGGAMALWSFEATFWLAGMAMLVSCTIAVSLTEPSHKISTVVPGTTREALRATMAQSVLRWIFVLVVVMYGFSHLPFVFGQPFIAAALQDVGLSDEAPLVSGGVSAVMMGLSLIASLFAVRLRGKIGLSRILLVAFGMQIALISVLAFTQSWIAIAVLFLRMVPDALSGPFVMGRIQPLLRDDVRATYVSVQNLSGKLVFSVSLLVAAGSASTMAEMPHADIRTILMWYIAAGAVVWLGLALSARSAGVEVPRAY
ncbi:Major facilitator superfamily MFS 1 [Sulfitobacter noctilucae]|uniref:MFS transporter n=1 Tax=Sulfitobacter noctilucae TaxID=1342302 RepID=UPI0004693A6B|nr:MFS transporter [Sulfitobacter noctilucae]KIN65499.1 Major facilitator superfamily MFS 1 [Sulfitobacter noctilucae]